MAVQVDFYPTKKLIIQSLEANLPIYLALVELISCQFLQIKADAFLKAPLSTSLKDAQRQLKYIESTYSKISVLLNLFAALVTYQSNLPIPKESSLQNLKKELKNHKSSIHLLAWKYLEISIKRTFLKNVQKNNAANIEK